MTHQTVCLVMVSEVMQHVKKSNTSSFSRVRKTAI